MRYFKIKTGFNAEDFIPIDETELDKALYAQITGAVGLFKNGSIRGNNIISIKEDWHKAMGWNYGHSLSPEDFKEISKSCKEYVGAIAEAKMRVDEIMKTGDTHLLGKNLPAIPEKV